MGWALSHGSFYEAWCIIQSSGKSCRPIISQFIQVGSELCMFCLHCWYLLCSSPTKAKQNHINLPFLWKLQVSLLGKHKHSTKPYRYFWQLNLKLAGSNSVCSKTMHNVENRSFSVSLTKGDTDQYRLPSVNIISNLYTVRRVQAFFTERRANLTKDFTYTQKNNCNIKEMHWFKHHRWFPVSKSGSVVQQKFTPFHEIYATAQIARAFYKYTYKQWGLLVSIINQKLLLHLPLPRQNCQHSYVLINYGRKAQKETVTISSY